MDYGRLIRTGLIDWWKEPSLRRWFVSMVALYFAFSLIEISKYWIEPPMAQLPSGISSRLHGEFFMFPTLPGEVSILSIISAILMAFVGRDVLTWRGLPAKTINIREGFMFFLLGIYQLIMILIVRLNLKWLTVLLVSLDLILLGVISNGLGLWFGSVAYLGILGLVVYLGLLVYHWYRLAFSNIFWLSEPVSMSSALGKSWEFTRGRTRELFLGLLVILLIVGIAVSTVAVFGLALINSLTEFSYNAAIRLVGIAAGQLINDIGAAFLSLAGLSIITEVFIQFRQSSVAPTESKVHKEAEGKSWRYFFGMAVALCILLVGFMVLVNHPSIGDSNQDINLSEEGNYTEAIRTFDESLKINPQNATAWNEKGIVLAKLGRYDDAIKAYNEAIKVYDDALKNNPQDADAWNKKGKVLINLGRNDDAIEAFDEALKINPQFAEAWFSKGNALSDLGRDEEAIKAYDEALKVNPQYIDALNNKGLAFGSIGRYEEAIKAFDEALKINPQDAEVWYNKGLAFGSLGRYEEEIKAYDEALRINPQDADTWYNKGISLSDLGRDEEAIKAYDEALKINPQNYKAWHNKGNVLSKLGRKEEANKAYSEEKKLQKLPGFELISAIAGLVMITHLLRRK